MTSTSGATIPAEQAQPVLTGRFWWLRMDGHPPRPNRTLRGSFTASREKQRRQRMAIQGEIAEWKRKTAIKVREEQVPAMTVIRVSAVFVRRAMNVADEDGDRSALKPCIDSLVKCGVIPNDTRRHLVWGPVTERRGPVGVDVLIEECE